MGILGALTGALGWVGKIVGLVPTVVQLVETIGKVFKLSGSQKKEAALAAVKDAIMLSEEFAGKEIADEDAFQEGLSKAIDGIVAMMNATEWKK